MYISGGVVGEKGETIYLSGDKERNNQRKPEERRQLGKFFKYSTKKTYEQLSGCWKEWQ